MLCVMDAGLAEKLSLTGAKLLRKSNDINGVPVWFFDTDKTTYDISDAVRRGQAFFSNTASVAF